MVSYIWNESSFKDEDFFLRFFLPRCIFTAYENERQDVSIYLIFDSNVHDECSLQEIDHP